MPLIANKVTEKDLRDYLTSRGFFGRSAKLHKLELVGIEPPGWVQIFEFHVDAKRATGDWVTLFGTCRGDERNGTFEVRTFNNRTSQTDSIQEETAGMIARDRKVSAVPEAALFFAGFVALAATAVAIAAVI